MSQDPQWSAIKVVCSFNIEHSVRMLDNFDNLLSFANYINSNAILPGCLSERLFHGFERHVPVRPTILHSQIQLSSTRQGTEINRRQRSNNFQLLRLQSRPVLNHSTTLSKLVFIVFLGYLLVGTGNREQRVEGGAYNEEAKLCHSFRL